MSDANKENSDTRQQGESQPIFRDEALAYIATPSDVNKIISVVGSGTWILIFVFSVMMLTKSALRILLIFKYFCG